MSDQPSELMSLIQSHQQIDTLMDLRRYQEALPLLSQALAQDPEDDHLHMRMAAVQMELDQDEQALNHARSALSLNPENDASHYLLSHLAMKRFQFSLALEHAQAACRIDPEDPSNLSVLAWAHYHQGQHKQALEAGRQAIELQPDDARLHGLLGHLELSIERYKPAIAHYRAALSHQADEADLHHGLGVALANTRQWTEAASHQLTAVQMAPAVDGYRASLFHLIHHHLKGQSDPKRMQAWQSLPDSIRQWADSEANQQSWHERMRVTSIALYSLLGLLLLSLLFSWILGEPIAKLMIVTAVVVAAFAGLWLFRKVMTLRNQRHLARLSHQDNDPD